MRDMNAWNISSMCFSRDSWFHSVSGLQLGFVRVESLVKNKGTGGLLGVLPVGERVDDPAAGHPALARDQDAGEVEGHQLAGRLVGDVQVSGVLRDVELVAGLGDELTIVELAGRGVDLHDRARGAVAEPGQAVGEVHAGVAEAVAEEHVHCVETLTIEQVLFHFCQIDRIICMVGG